MGNPPEVSNFDQLFQPIIWGHIESVKILVILNPTGYMLTYSSFDAFIHLRSILL